MEPFKNKISADLVQCLGGHLERHLPDFQRQVFEHALLTDLPALELKQRSERIADALHEVLPLDLAKRYEVLRKILHPSEDGAGIDRGSDADGIRGWGMMPLGMIVSRYGLGDFEASFALLKEMTKRATAEFDVRPFLDADQDTALDILSLWVADPNKHVRRLVSEGTRPRLPWGMQLKQLIADPSPTLPLLEALKDDPEDYVRRSVANHLNDIAKDHPDLVADLAASWLQGAGRNRQRLVKHACRSLIKNGHPEALRAFGLDSPLIDVEGPGIAGQTVRFGSALAFDVVLTSRSAREQTLLVDYVVHFRKANGSLSGKVFKWTTVTLRPGEQLRLSRTHAIRPITTRKYYSGTQAVSLRVNGQDFGYSAFELQMEEPALLAG
ncbi:DNA alkylation repair protein [Roseibium sp. RKSG952]|uniref:DNA alkylation repair protein n=1 Tax=Roseibium sp. RKSG952 TaxID=2529384 RepID=UPI0012BBE4F3|nr:DNA alkylation repair protein [Roseibium sp. RKSG952]MTI00308.1 DNA alkylation repair protein [Roseibium sp. RKSG952]